MNKLLNMEDKTSEDIIKEFARITNRVAVIKNIPVSMSGFRSFQKYKKLVYMPYDSSNTNYFVWLSDPYARVGIPTVISGAFIPISSRVKSKLNIRSKFFLDRLNFLSRSKSNEFGSDKFNSKVVVTGNVDGAEKRLLSQPRIQNQILEALRIANDTTISINEYNIDFVPKLKGKSYLSIINPQGWELERDKIEEIFRRMEKIRNIISY